MISTLHIDVKEAFKAASANGHLDVTKWLEENIHTKEYAKFEDGYVAANTNKHSHNTEWIENSGIHKADNKSSGVHDVNAMLVDIENSTSNIESQFTKRPEILTTNVTTAFVSTKVNKTIVKPVPIDELFQALTSAVKNGNEKDIELLIFTPSKKISIPVRDVLKLVFTNLINENNARGADLLIKATAGHPKEQKAMISTQKDSTFQWAAKNGHIGIVKLMLEGSNGQQTRIKKDEYKACKDALVNGHIEIVKLLLETIKGGSNDFYESMIYSIRSHASELALQNGDIKTSQFKLLGGSGQGNIMGKIKNGTKSICLAKIYEQLCNVWMCYSAFFSV